MKKTLLLLMVLSVYLSGCMGADAPSTGSEKDANGCIVSQGYVWCAAKGRCILPSQESCEEPPTNDTPQEAASTSSSSSSSASITSAVDIVGGGQDSHGCIGSAGYSWCESKKKCLRVWEENCEEFPAGWGPVYSVVENTSNACENDGECKTPESYLVRSNCPYSSKCIAGRCAVVCPLKNDSTLPERESTHKCTVAEKQNNACTMDYNPVCGSDGKTYANGCGACGAGANSWTAGECKPTKNDSSPSKLANPASVYCGRQGGTWSIKETPEGQLGYCNLPDGRKCEEWVLFRSNGTDCKP